MPPVATRCSWLPPPTPSIKCIAFVLSTAYDLISSQAASGSAPVSSQVISERYALPEAASTRLVIVNGTLRPELSDLSGLPKGVYLGSIQGAPAASAAILVRGGALGPDLSALSGLPKGVYLGSIQGAPAASAAILVGGSQAGGEVDTGGSHTPTGRQAGRGSRQAGCDAL